MSHSSINMTRIDLYGHLFEDLVADREATRKFRLRSSPPGTYAYSEEHELRARLRMTYHGRKFSTASVGAFA